MQWGFMRHELGSECAKLSQIQSHLSLMSSLHYFKWKQKKVLQKTHLDLGSVQLSSLIHRDIWFLQETPTQKLKDRLSILYICFKEEKKPEFKSNLHNFLPKKQNNIREELKEILAVLTQLSYSVPF